MIKTYLKHLVLDKFLNSIFDGLMETFGILPKLVIGKKYRMIVFEYKSINLAISTTDNIVETVIREILENVIINNIDHDSFTFSYEHRSSYRDDVFVSGDLYMTRNYPDSRITMVFE